MSEIEYKPASIADAEARYRDVQLEPRQRDLVTYLGRTVATAIGMTEIASRGYWVMAIIEWQKEKRVSVASLETKPSAVRIAAAKEIAGHFRELVTRALVHEAHKTRLEESLKTSLATYLKEFAAK